MATLKKISKEEMDDLEERSARRETTVEEEALYLFNLGYDETRSWFMATVKVTGVGDVMHPPGHKSRTVFEMLDEENGWEDDEDDGDAA